MNSDQYFHRGLRLIVTSVLVFSFIVLFCVMVSRGFPFWLALVLLVPAGLCVATIPTSVPQVWLRGDRIGYGDLCHYGWNVWNAFKGARNQFYDQSELSEWLKSGFESLGKYNTNTLRAKLRTTDGGYGIRLVDNLKEYIQQWERKFSADIPGTDEVPGIFVWILCDCNRMYNSHF